MLQPGITPGALQLLPTLLLRKKEPLAPMSLLTWGLGPEAVTLAAGSPAKCTAQARPGLIAGDATAQERTS